MGIDSMVAGAELDATVAEEVMGLEAAIYSAPDVTDPLRCRVLVAEEVPGGEFSEWQLFEPSTDWSAAGELWDELSQRGIYLGVWPTPEGWDVERYETGNDWVQEIPTGPMAICLAALAAVRKNNR